MPFQKKIKDNKVGAADELVSAKSKFAPFVLAALQQLITWMDNLIRAYSGEFGPYIDELRTGVRFDDPPVPAPPANANNKIQFQLWQNQNVDRSKIMSDRTIGRQKFIGVCFEHLPPNVVDRIQMRAPNMKINGDLHLLKDQVTLAFNLKSAQSIDRYEDSVLKAIHNFKTKNKVTQKDYIITKIKVFKNDVIGLNSSYGLPPILWSKQLHILFECLGGELTEVHTKYLNMETEIATRRPPPGMAELTQAQLDRIEDERSWVPRDLVDFEDLVLRYETASSKLGHSVHRESSFLMDGNKGGRGGGHKSSDITCYRCKQKGHKADDCPQSAQSDSKCFICKKKGHRADSCPRAEAFAKFCDKSDAESDDDAVKPAAKKNKTK